MTYDTSASAHAALCTAIMASDVTLVAEVLQHGWYHLNLQENQDEAIKLAARMGSLDVFRFLHKMGANVRTQQDSCLRLAIKADHTDIIKYLASMGADLHIDHDYCLYHAIRNCNLDLVQYLITQGLDYGAKCYRCLRLAAKLGHDGVLTYLLTFIEDLEVRHAALISAAKGGFLSTVMILHKAGANVCDPPVLKAAVTRNYFPLCQYLVSQGADVTNITLSECGISVRPYIQIQKLLTSGQGLRIMAAKCCVQYHMDLDLALDLIPTEMVQLLCSVKNNIEISNF